MVDGLESAMGVTKVKLDGVISQTKKNPSASDISSQVESLLAKYSNTESALVAQRQAVDKVVTGLEQKMEIFRSVLCELHSNMATLDDAPNKKTSNDMDQQIQNFKERLSALEGIRCTKPGIQMSSTTPDP